MPTVVVQRVSEVVAMARGARIADAYERAFPGPPQARSAPVVSGFPIPEALISIAAIAVRPG